MNCDDADILLERAGIDKKLLSYEILDKIDKYITSKEVYKNEHMLKALHYKKFSEQINAMSPDEALEFGKFIIAQDQRDAPNVRSLETDAIAFFMRSHQKLADFMEEARPTMFGYKNRNDIHEDFIRAFAGTPKDKKMRDFHDLYMDIKNEFSVRYENATGEKLGIRRGVDFPQMNDSLKISKVSAEEWHNDIVELLDLDQMGITREKLREFLVIDGDIKSRHSIISRNFEKAIEGVHDKDSVGRYKNKRFFIFKDSESWLKYQKKYGSESIYASLNDDLHQMSKEIALIEKFGPNPKEMFNNVMNMIADKTNNKDFIRLSEIDYGNFTGVLNIPQSEKLAIYGANLRNTASPILLGAAPIAASIDIVFSSVSLRSNGFRVGNAMKISAKNLFRNIADRKKSSAESGKMYAGMMHALDTVHATSRLIETEGSGFLAKTAHAINSVSGLNVWTIASKTGASAEMHSKLADGTWNNKIDNMLKRYGITGKDIKLFRNAGTVKNKEYGIEMPDYSKMDYKTAEAFIGAVKMEGLKGTLEMTIRNQTHSKQGLKPGTPLGEIIRLIMQFGQFPMQVLIGPLRYGFSKTGMDRIKHLSGLIMGTTILGTFAVQFKRINSGYETYDWNDEELWMKGLLQGGSLSFIADIFFSDKSYGKGIGDIAPAPVISLFNKYLWQGVFGDIANFKDKGFTEGFNDLIKTSGVIIEDVNPLKRLWYTRIIVKRMIGDNVLRATNPDYDMEQMRKELNRR